MAVSISVIVVLGSGDVIASVAFMKLLVADFIVEVVG